jgi:hypothetical protein
MLLGDARIARFRRLSVSKRAGHAVPYCDAESVNLDDGAGKNRVSPRQGRPSNATVRFGRPCYASWSSRAHASTDMLDKADELGILVWRFDGGA